MLLATLTEDTEIVSLLKINEGHVVASSCGWAVSLSYHRITYSEPQNRDEPSSVLRSSRSVAFCDIEHGVDPYVLHVYLETLEFADSGVGSGAEREKIIERIKSAVAFLGINVEYLEK